MRNASGIAAGLGGLLALALWFGLSACSQRENQPPTAPQFSAKEIKALEAAAEGGDPVEKYKLAKKFHDGDTVPRDLTNAAVWLRKSAEAGYSKAQYHLALAYEGGEGVRKDAAEATKWYLRAAAQDNAAAQEKLGFIYWKAEGTNKNLVEAYKWLSLAAGGGESKAAKGLKKIELLMNPQQVADAKKLAASFIPKKEFKKSGKNS